jgi:hypothetical protein
MRGQAWLLVAVVGLWACGGTYSGEAEPLFYPKKKEIKTEGAQAACPPELDTCKTDFGSPPKWPTPAPKQRQAHSLAQDADNKMESYGTSACVARKKKAYDAVTIVFDALKTDPYNPYATYSLASIYAQVGKKKCSIAMITRLNELGKTPELATQVTELKTRGKTDSSFDAMRKEADGAFDAK